MLAHLLLFACARPHGADTGTGAHGVDSAPDAVSACPDGMVLVPATPAYCIDAYEVQVDADGTAHARAGVVPTEGRSYDEAAAACRRTPAVDASGMTYGTKRLASTREWEDAADGVVGAGGTRWPYGDAYVEGACATLAADGSQPVQQTAASGSYPACVSVFGMFDAIGNLWEWVDPGMEVDVPAALEARAREGYALRADDDGRLHLDAGDPSRLELRIGGLGQDRAPNVAADGALFVRAEQVLSPPERFFPAGFLTVAGPTPSRADAYLPVELVTPAEAGGPWAVTLRAADDGSALTDKRGCAYYTCPPEAQDLHVPVHEHPHDFRGSIGFRCVADPYTAR